MLVSYLIAGNLRKPISELDNITHLMRTITTCDYKSAEASEVGDLLMYARVNPEENRKSFYRLEALILDSMG